MENVDLVISKRTTPIPIPKNLIQINQTWLDGKRLELERAKKALSVLSILEVSERKIKRTQERVRLLVRVVKALEAGYVILPRFDAQKLNLSMDEFPLSAIVEVSQAEAQRFFDEIRFVAGRAPVARRGPWGRLNARDPLIIGVIRTPEVIDNSLPRERKSWSLEEHFLIAWWRPEDERMEEIF